MAVTIDLGGKVALITGAGRGIGRETAQLIAAAGGRVAIVDLVEDSAKAAASEIAKSGGQAIGVSADVTKPADALRMVDEALRAFGRLDILVNNAARWTVKPFKDLTPQDYDTDIGIALLGTLHSTRAAVDALVKQGSGRIINVASDAGRVGEPFLTVYSAAKAGVIGFTKALAKELGRYNITVNAVAPGTTRTPGAQEFIQGVGEEKMVKAYPLRRLGEPRDIAGAILFFASDLAGYVTGQILSVSGGYSTAG
ncbi:MAG: short-chain dehydrogenase [candidate division NC10 bacterium RIFCSPLOWO2_12_FULL_66_18]|nr:MAG: short-chain dehydrogenase [candidate division NC10 bacterium RIFCSPLOWO2_02_FULL_66_22]OGB97073.1 MAG: short-chain dehydrogenase [candidate division NC10 bacterium RIFCSPLOWO2_12_FULL_66_18]